MKVHYTSDALDTLAADVIAVQVYGKPTAKNEDVDFVFDARVATLDAKVSGALSELAKSEQFKGKPDQTLTLHALGNIRARTILLVGAGNASKGTFNADKSFAATAVRRASALRAKSIVL